MVVGHTEKDVEIFIATATVINGPSSGYCDISIIGHQGSVIIKAKNIAGKIPGLILIRIKKVGNLPSSFLCNKCDFVGSLLVNFF